MDVPPTCNEPWIAPKLPIPSKEMCIANLGKTTAKDNLCAEEGGETISFTYWDTGAVGTSLSEELSTGIIFFLN